VIILFFLLMIWLCGQVTNMFEKFRTERNKRATEVICGKVA